MKKQKAVLNLGGSLVEWNIVTDQTSQAVDDGRHGNGLRGVDVAPHLVIILVMFMLHYKYSLTLNYSIRPMIAE